MKKIKIKPLEKVQIKGKQSGMLLIEVLFSILIFSFGILGLVGMQAISTKNAVSAEDRTTAASLANDMVAQMWLRKSSDVTATPLKTDFEKWKTRVANSKLSNVEVPTVTTANGITTVTVTWKSPASSGGSSTLITHQYSTQFSM